MESGSEEGRERQRSRSSDCLRLFFILYFCFRLKGNFYITTICSLISCLNDFLLITMTTSTTTIETANSFQNCDFRLKKIDYLISCLFLDAASCLAECLMLIIQCFKAMEANMFMIPDLRQDVVALHDHEMIEKQTFSVPQFYQSNARHLLLFPGIHLSFLCHFGSKFIYVSLLPFSYSYFSN